jgi:hypothetical protein
MFCMQNLFGAFGDLWDGATFGDLSYMTTFRPTEIHQLAIQAKLNFALGARVYDEVFAGFEVLELIGDELRGWAASEYRAAVIDIHFSGEVARIAESVLSRPVRRTSFLLRGMRHDTGEQPALGADASGAVAFCVPTSKRRAILARRKGVRSLRGMLMRSKS